MPIKGLGPRGERTSTLLQLDLTEAEIENLRHAQKTAAIVLHTKSSDWSRQQLAGIVSTLGYHSTAVIDVIDCEFSFRKQNEALERLARHPPSAIISIPIGNMAVAESHRSAARAGTKMILLDNAPAGLLPGTDYACLVSADNFGLGHMAAELLSPHVPDRRAIVIASYGVDFFVTHQRELAFRKRMAEARPDVTLRTVRFTDIDLVGEPVEGFLSANPAVSGLFVVWDEPAMQVVRALHARSRFLPVVTVDLGQEAAFEMAADGMIVGVGAQQPYDQGVAAGMAALQALVGRPLPSWIALPGIKVTRENVLQAYQTVWHKPAPPELISRSLESKGPKPAISVPDYVVGSASFRRR